MMFSNIGSLSVTKLEAAAVAIAGVMACTVWFLFVVSSGNYFDNLAFQPAMPSSVEQAEKFAAPIPGITTDDDTLVIIGPSGTGAVGASVDDGAVYGVGYYSINGSDWKPFDISGEKVGKGWIMDGASFSLRFRGSDFSVPAGGDEYVENFIAVFSCTETNMGWDCRAGKWQLLTFEAHVMMPQGNGTEGCGTCPAGYECVGSTCEKKSAGNIKLFAGETVILQMAGGQKYLIRVVGIDGDGEGARLYINGENIEVDKTGKSTVVRGTLGIKIKDIMEFTAAEDGFVEFFVEGNYAVIESCPECIPAAGGGSSSGGRSGGGGGSSCSADCSCASSICTTSSCPNGCGGTCPGTLSPDCGARECGVSPNGCGSCGGCNTTAGEYCSNGTCVVGHCTPDCSCAAALCVGLICDDTCGGNCTGMVQPDCGTRICGPAPNGCAGTNACGACASGSCMDGFCLPTIPPPPQA